MTAQSENEAKIKEFIKQINIKNTLIKVDSVSVEYVDMDKSYTDFKKIIKPKETDERLDTAAEHLKELIVVTKEGNKENKKGFSNLSKEIREGNEKLLDMQDQMLDKQDNNTEVLSEKLDKMSGKLNNIHEDLSVNLKSFHHDTIARFDIVDEKYGKIAENIEKAVYAINRTCDNTEKMLEKSEKDRHDYKDSMKDLVGAIVKLAEKKQ